MSSLRVMIRSAVQLKQVGVLRSKITPRCAYAMYHRPAMQTCTGLLQRTHVRFSHSQADDTVLADDTATQETQHTSKLDTDTPALWDNYIYLSDLPFRTRKQHIIEYLDGVEIADGQRGIIGTYRGVAWVKLKSADDVEKALAKSRTIMDMPIQVSKLTGHADIAKYIEAEDALGLDFTDEGNERYLKLTNLPYGATPEQLIRFFEGIELVDDSRIRQLMSATAGCAFVQLKNEQDLYTAIQRNRTELGGRTINIMKTNHDFIMKMFMDQQGREFCVHLRGLPFNSHRDEIASFLGSDIRIRNGMQGIRYFGKGTAEVYLDSQEDFDRALAKDRQYIGRRYIEVRKCL